jgi:hypothetical protein
MKIRLFPIIAILAVSVSMTMAGSKKRLFDGKTMRGWELKAVHGGRGGVWTVEHKALVANQDTDHSGGLLGTTTQFSDYEIELDFKADYPVDSGVFLRTREDGMGYQVTIDYRDGGFVGSLYAPAEGGFIAQYADWEKAYRQGKWNHLRARITGQPAHITAWLNKVKTIDFTDTRERYPHSGYIGLQVHGGEGAWGANSRARFRHIRIRPL